MGKIQTVRTLRTCFNKNAINIFHQGKWVVLRNLKNKTAFLSKNNIFLQKSSA